MTIWIYRFLWIYTANSIHGDSPLVNSESLGTLDVGDNLVTVFEKQRFSQVTQLVQQGFGPQNICFGKLRSFSAPTSEPLEIHNL